MADSHLRIMINLDWFQLFDLAMYSCGAIYGVICNLPHKVRFKKENMLTLGLFSELHEVKLHKINHYLALIVDELLELWEKGFSLLNGKKIRLAVICCFNDILAVRKLCSHISALVRCYRCYKRASSNEKNQRPNFEGFDDMSDWFKMKDPQEHRQNALV